tara:strand:- start:537 stop:923 length:387 start_codon:yes stop_codon:yes gene_type:complete
MFGFSKYFWFCSLVFCANQLVEKIGLGIAILSSYLDDLLCPGIVLGLALFVQQQFTYRNPNFVLPLSSHIIFWIWYSFLFENLLPKIDDRHFSDPWDTLMYAIGTVLFYFLGNVKTKNLFFFRRNKPD